MSLLHRLLPRATPAVAPAPAADVCLLLEGTYPYVAGGVSSWVHDLIGGHPELTFHVVSLLPDPSYRKEHKYKIPANLTGITHVYLQRLAPGEHRLPGVEKLLPAIAPLMQAVQARGGLAEVAALDRALAPHRGRLGRGVLMDSRAAFKVLTKLYGDVMPGASFLDFFWTWRSLFGGLFAVLLAEVPPAKVYHAVSTGYAGLLGARLTLETQRPLLLTEHGIYTNERRIEIAMADWLQDTATGGLMVDKPRRDLRDMWIDTFVSYSRATYEACAEIITLYGGNQDMQLRDGAPPDRLKVIPNGIDYAKFSKVERGPREGRRPTVAFIGRVVPIKDVKTFLRAISILRASVPDVLADILGPQEEDAEYYEECRRMVEHLGLQDTVRFLGRVNLTDHLGRVDVIALTSISEAQPLVILEAGASGVPTVATDVGACREMILGPSYEDPHLGPAGAITPVASPAATADALRRLLLDLPWWRRCSDAIKERVRRSYNKVEIDRIYGELYHTHIAAPDRAVTIPTDKGA